MKSGSRDPEIKFISKWSRDNTRRIDRKSYRITYRELKAILLRYGFHLENPDNNYIDVIKFEKRKRIFGLLKSEEVAVRVGKIGFPRWGAQVSDGTLKQARALTGLSPKDGVDSGAFFHGLDPMQQLIATYNDPLIRLADR